MCLVDSEGDYIGVEVRDKHACLIDATLVVHSYAALRRAAGVPASTASSVFAAESLLDGHPDVFFTADFRQSMSDPEFLDPSKLGARPAHLAKSVSLDSLPARALV